MLFFHLQFNAHVFKLEQEEYVREKIKCVRRVSSSLLPRLV